MPLKHQTQPGPQQLDYTLRANEAVSELLAVARLHPDHPERPPDWRWQCALRKANKHDKTLAVEDEFVLKALRFASKLIYLQECTGQALDLSKDDREFCMAWDIYSSCNTARRHELEARLLSQELYEDVSKKTAIPVRVISTYEAVFYNVSDRLDSPSYIIHHAIGPIFDEDIRVISDYSMWKLLGYWCGPLAIDMVVFNKPPVLKEDDPRPRDEILRDYIRDKIFYMLHQTKLKGSEDLFMAFQSFNKLQQLLVGELGTSLQKQFLENLRLAMSSIKWTNASQRECIDVSFDSLDNYVHSNNRLTQQN